MIAIFFIIILQSFGIAGFTASVPLPEQNTKISVNFHLTNTHNAPAENTVVVAAKQGDTQTVQHKETPQVKPQEDGPTRLQKLRDFVIIPAFVLMSIIKRKELANKLATLRR